MRLQRLLCIPALLLILSTGVGAMTLSEADRALRSSAKTEVFRAYDTYKSHYLDAVVKQDTALQKRCLDGIVSSGRKLHIDVKNYEKKLALFSGNRRASGTSVNEKLPKVTAQNRLEDVRWENGKLVFTFEKKLGKKDINFFKLKKTAKQGYRYVFDMHGAMTKGQTLSHRDIKRISLAQYKPSTLRLVLESDAALPVRYSHSGNTVKIDAGVAKVTSPKSTPGFASAAATVPQSKTVVIDPGHGGKDGGAIGYKNMLEKEIVLAIAKKTAAILRDRGFTVYLTRNGDRYIKLRSRTSYANQKNADLFVSIHANAVPKRNVNKAYGIETYFLSPSRSERATNAAAKENSTEIEDMNFYGKSVFLNALNSEKIIASHKLAIDMQSSILSSLRARYGNVKDGGVREGPFWVLVGAQMPAVLVEVGFITHPKEGMRLKSSKYQDYFARGLADGVERYFAKNR